MINKSNFQWQHIGGKLNWISSGKDIVFGVNRNGGIFYRAGMSSSSPVGTSWVRVPGKLSQVDTHDSKVVGANSDQNTFSLTITHTPGKVKQTSERSNCTEKDVIYFITRRIP